MQHFSCDLCGKELDPTHQDRYQISISGKPINMPAKLSEDSLEHSLNDQDTVDELEALLDSQSQAETIDEDVATPVAPVSTMVVYYDFCGGCYGKFCADPLGKKRSHRFDFSSN